jgi:hypothetical protein
MCKHRELRRIVGLLAILMLSSCMAAQLKHDINDGTQNGMGEQTIDSPKNNELLEVLIRAYLLSKGNNLNGIDNEDLGLSDDGAYPSGFMESKKRKNEQYRKRNMKYLDRSSERMKLKADFIF